MEKEIGVASPRKPPLSTERRRDAVGPPFSGLKKKSERAPSRDVGCRGAEISVVGFMLPSGHDDRRPRTISAARCERAIRRLV